MIGQGENQVSSPGRSYRNDDSGFDPTAPRGSPRHCGPISVNTRHAFPPSLGSLVSDIDKYRNRRGLRGEIRRSGLTPEHVTVRPESASSVMSRSSQTGDPPAADTVHTHLGGEFLPRTGLIEVVAQRMEGQGWVDGETHPTDGHVGRKFQL